MKKSRTAKSFPKPSGAALKTAATLAKPAIPASFHAAGLVLAALVLGFILYQPAMNGPFLFDDRYLPFLQLHLIGKPLAAWFVGLRPLVNLSFWINAVISGDETWSYHAGNVILHALNSVLVYGIARWFLDLVDAPISRRKWLAIFSGALFLVHPLQTESVAYITSRSETLAVFFFYSAYLLFLNKRDRGLNWLWTFAVLALFAASQLTKEYAAVFPILLVLTDVLFPARLSPSVLGREEDFLSARQTLLRNWRVYASMLLGVALAGALILHVLKGSTSAGFGLKGVSPLDYFLTECRAIWGYLRLSVLPAGLNVDPEFPFTHGFGDPMAILGLLALLAAFAAAVYYRARYRLASFGFFALLLCLAPTSSFLPIADPFAEHRMYLPMFAAILMVLEVILEWNPERGTLLTATSCLLAVFAVLTFARNSAWGNELELWKDTAGKSPAKLRPRFQLALAYYTSSQCEQSVREFERASTPQPPSASFLHDWAEAEDCAGNDTKALKLFEQSAQQMPSGLVSSQVAMVLAKLGRYDEALAELGKAELQEPDLAAVYAYRGNIFYLQGLFTKAVDQFQHALTLDPQNRMAAEGLPLAQRRAAAASH